MNRRLRHALLIAGLSVGPAAAQTISYSDSSSSDKLQSKVGLGVEEGTFALNADMTLVGEHGETRVLPRLSSSWTALDLVDVKTVLAYADLNRGGSFAPTIDTNLLIGSVVPFVDGFEAKLRRSETLSSEALKVDLSGIDTGLQLFGGTPLGIDGEVALKDGHERLHAASSIVSTFGLGGALDVKSVWRFESAADLDTGYPTVDTVLVYRTPLPFIERVEGTVHRAGGSAARQSLAFLFPEVSRGQPYGRSFKVSSRAIIEESLRTDGMEAVSMGVETSFSGFLPPLLGGRNALSFKVEHMLETDGARSSSLAYDHAWSPLNGASIGLKLKVLKDLEDIEPSMGVNWSTEF